MYVFLHFIVHVLMIFIVHLCFFIDGPDEPSVFLNPSKSSFYVGEDLTLSCSADSNPTSKILRGRSSPQNISME